jgi:hypothetical protein
MAVYLYATLQLLLYVHILVADWRQQPVATATLAGGQAGCALGCWRQQQAGQQACQGTHQRTHSGENIVRR